MKLLKVFNCDLPDEQQDLKIRSLLADYFLNKADFFLTSVSSIVSTSMFILSLSSMLDKQDHFPDSGKQPK